MSHEIPNQPAEAGPQPEPTLADNLALMANQNEQLTSELGAFAGTNTYPDWWLRQGVYRSTIAQQLRDPDADPKYISEYFQLSSARRDLDSAITGRHYRITPIASLSAEIGIDTVVKGFAAESQAGALHATIHTTLTEAAGEEQKYIGTELGILRTAYGKDRVTDLLNPATDDYGQSLRPLLRSENALRAMRIADDEHGSNDSWQEDQRKYHKWMAKALSAATSMNEIEAADYTFAASKISKRDKPIVDILDKFDRFGAERLREIADFTGIHSFENYSNEQLERMAELVKDPQRMAKRLASHDVNVVMINRVGDYNGVLTNTAEIYEDGTDRTLFFEINNMGDIYRYMLKLRDAGIKPSSLMLAAHSTPGQFMVADERDPSMKRRDIATIAGRSLVQSINGTDALKPGDFGYAMHNMKGMARIVEDFMQSSRGLDDDAEDIGRKKILFQACHAASEDQSVDFDANGARFVMGMDSIITRLAADLATKDIHSDVDIYGAPGGIQVHKSKRGIRYSGPPAEDTIARQKLQAVRVRLENNELTRQEIDEVLLHKNAA